MTRHGPSQRLMPIISLVPTWRGYEINYPYNNAGDHSGEKRICKNDSSGLRVYLFLKAQVADLRYEGLLSLADFTLTLLLE